MQSALLFTLSMRVRTVNICAMLYKENLRERTRTLSKGRNTLTFQDNGLVSIVRNGVVLWILIHCVLCQFTKVLWEVHCVEMQETHWP